MGWFDKAKAAFGVLTGAGATASNPVSAIAGAVGAVAGAVGAGEKLADDTKLLNAGAAEGVQKDAAQGQKRVDDAAAARNDDKLRSSVEDSRFRD